MGEKIHRQILRLKALDRWENEGGSIDLHQWDNPGHLTDQQTGGNKTTRHAQVREQAEITGAKIGESYDKYVGGIALGRAQTPEDVAGFVSYLAGPDSDYMTGQPR